MTKHQWLAYTAGIWCFFVTAICCLIGIYSTDPMTLLLNILTPIVLTALGLILPFITGQMKEIGNISNWI